MTTFARRLLELKINGKDTDEDNFNISNPEDNKKNDNPSTDNEDDDFSLDSDDNSSDNQNEKDDSSDDDTNDDNSSDNEDDDFSLDSDDNSSDNQNEKDDSSDDDTNDDNSSDNEDDSMDNTTEESNESPEDEEKKESEKIIYSSLSDDQKRIRVLNLKTNFKDLYETLINALDGINRIPRNTNNLDTLRKLNFLLVKSKNILISYINNNFDNSSYLENYTTYLKYMAIFRTTTKVIEELNNENKNYPKKSHN